MTRLEATTRAQLAAWRGHLTATRDAAAARARRHVSALLVFCGALGMIGGAFLIGRWAAGLVIIAESGFAVWVGLNREDGTGLPLRGARTVEQVLADEALRE